jgi:hypothetical protein
MTRAALNHQPPSLGGKAPACACRFLIPIAAQVPASPMPHVAISSNIASRLPITVRMKAARTPNAIAERWVAPASRTRLATTPNAPTALSARTVATARLYATAASIGTIFAGNDWIR